MKSSTFSEFQKLSRKKKLQYIRDYYKIHIIAAVALICILFSIITTICKNKSVDLYTAYVNVAVSDEFTDELSNTSKLSITNYTNLLITENPASENLEYAYASSMKLMAAISDDKLDIIIADRYGIDMADSNGYLLNPKEFLADNPTLYSRIEPYFIYDKTGIPYAIDLSSCDHYKSAGFSDTVYLGIVASDTRQKNILTYLEFLFLQ